MFEVLDKVSIMVLGENKCANTNMQERLDILCSTFCLSVHEKNRIYKVKRDANSNKELLPEVINRDRIALYDFISNVFSHPELFTNSFDKIKGIKCNKTKEKRDEEDNYIRCVVQCYSDSYITVYAQKNRASGSCACHTVPRQEVTSMAICAVYYAEACGSICSTRAWRTIRLWRAR